MLLTKSLLSFFKMSFCSVFFPARFKQEGECVGRWAGPERRRGGRGGGAGRGGPIISPDRSTQGGRNGRCTVKRGRREGTERWRQREEKQRGEPGNKNYIRDCTEEEWDEELKSIYLLFFCSFFVFQEFISCPTVQKCFFVCFFLFPSHTSHFLIFYFFLPFFFYYYCFVFFSVLQ